MKYWFIYLLLINVAGCLIMHADKQRARKNRWRIPETTLFTLAMLGGSFGVLLGMHIFRHKTRHIKFRIGVPVIMILQILLISTILPYLNK